MSLHALLTSLLATLALSVSACGGSSSPTPTPDETPCASVGVNLCAKIYSCYSAADIANLQYPATEDACVTELNAGCTGSGSAAPSSGFCKGDADAGSDAETACADELDSQTCAEFTGTPTGSDACKALCETD